MAKKKNGNYDVTGLSINEIMNIDLDTFNNMGERELKQITSRLVSASNKRIRTFEKKGITSPAVRSLGTNNRFSVKLSDDVTPQNRVNKLRQEYARARSFLSMKTSTMKGYNSYLKDIKEDIESQIGRPLKKGEITKAYRILHKMQESGQVDAPRSSGSMQAREIIFNILNDNLELDDDVIIEKANKEYEDYYENPDSENTYNG